MSHPQSTALYASPARSGFEILPRARTVRIAATLTMPVQLQASFRIWDRETPSGARGVLCGAVALPGLSAVLGFSHGSGMRRAEVGSVAREIALIPAGDRLAMTSYPFQADVAEGSRMQVQFRDSGAAALTDALRIGSVGVAPLGFCVSLFAPVAVLAEIATDDRAFGPGSRVTIHGKLAFPRGISARCTFRRSGDCGEEDEAVVETVDTVVVGVGQGLGFAAEVTLTPAPGRPLKSIVFLDGDGYRFATNGAPH